MLRLIIKIGDTCIIWLSKCSQYLTKCYFVLYCFYFFLLKQFLTVYRQYFFVRKQCSVLVPTKFYVNAHNETFGICTADVCCNLVQWILFNHFYILGSIRFIFCESRSPVVTLFVFVRVLNYTPENTGKSQIKKITT